MLIISQKQFILPEAKRSFCGKRYILIDTYKIEYGWHFIDFAYSFVLKRKTVYGWRRIIATYPDYHEDFQSVKEYLFWYKEFII